MKWAGLLRQVITREILSKIENMALMLYKCCCHVEVVKSIGEFYENASLFFKKGQLLNYYIDNNWGY